MDWKQLLNPNWKKVVIFLVLFVLFYSFAFWMGFSVNKEGKYMVLHGLPIPLIEITTEKPSINGFDLYSPSSVGDFISLIINIAFWYTISCFIYKKFIKKKA
jgi:hypothetical protein